MKVVDFLIVGGSAAGTTAADVLRNNNFTASITIVSDEPHGYYSRVLLPNYISGKIKREQVILKPPDWYKQKNIELILGSRAGKLDPKNQQVTLSSGEVIGYGKLLIAVGGKTIKMGVPGADLENVFYFKTIEDAERILAAAKRAKSAVVIGGGFIGLELIGSFKANKIENVTALILEPYLWFGKLDEASALVLTATLERNGVKVYVEEETDRFEGEGEVSAVISKTGNSYEAQVVGIGIGIRPDIEWLGDSGLDLGRGIITNEYLETNLPDVYAAGDCAEFYDVIFKRRHVLGNWANAVSQGNSVARTMLGQKTVFETASSYTSNFFDGSCSFVGVTDATFADEIINRGSVESGRMTRIFIKTIGGVMRIVGATVINCAVDVAPLTAAIKGKVDISAVRSKLSDIGINLTEVVNF